MISRPRVLKRIRGSAAYPVLLVVAPAGYGKTTAVAEWATGDPRPLAWLTLDALHDDPTLLAKSIATALDASEPVDGAVFDVIGVPRPGLSDLLVPRLIASISARATPFVLVVDDLHTVTSTTSLELLVELAAAVPPGSQVVMLSRSEPEIAVGRLRAQGQLAELGRSQLAMTRPEVLGLVAAAGVELPADGIDSLLEHTEGWPVAVYLALRSLQEAADPAAAVASFAGDDRLVADYLRDELIANARTEDAEFLTSCSILDKLTGPSCDALLESQGSANVLRRLSRDNLLVIPLDRSDREYRYHALFREMLQAELGRLGSDRQDDLHRRASAWYAEQGNLDRAIDHAIAGHDIEAAGNLMWAAAADYVSHGREATLRRFLDHYSEAQIAGSPMLALALASCHLIHGEGDEIERWTAAALAALPGVPAAQRPMVEIGAALIRAAGASHGELTAMAGAAADARRLLPGDSPWIALACLIEGAALHLRGDLCGGRALLEAGARRGSVAAPTVCTLCLSQLVLVALDEDDEGEAWRLEEQAAVKLERYGLADFATEALALAVSSLIRGRQGRIDDALAAARRAGELLAALPGISAWYEAETRVVLARALIRLGDVVAAQRQLEDAAPYLRKTPDAPVLAAMFDAAGKDLSTLVDEGGRWPLTPAELRLLRMLPTHLSFKEIAARQIVSVNTVKSQARAIYRKLGVASRAEAVACAEAGGLIASPDHGARTLAASGLPQPPAL